MARIPWTAVSRMGYARTPYNIRGLQTAMPTQQCLHCCELYCLQPFCKAVTRIRYACRRYGHTNTSPLCSKRKNVCAPQQHQQPPPAPASCTQATATCNQETQTEPDLFEKSTEELNSVKKDFKLLTHFIGELDDFYSIMGIQNQERIQELEVLIDGVCANSKKWIFDENLHCKRCGLTTKHKLKECPAHENYCYKCRKTNHFSFSCHKPKEHRSYVANIRFSEEIKTLLDKHLVNRPPL